MLDKILPYKARAEFCQLFRSIFGQWSFKKKNWWDLLYFNLCPTHLQVPLLNAVFTTFLKPFLKFYKKVVCTAWTVKFVFHALGFSWWTCQQDFPWTWRERRRWAVHWWICQRLSGRRWTHDVHCALFTTVMVFNSFQKKF